MKNTLLLFILLFIGGCGSNFCPPDKYDVDSFSGFLSYVFNSNKFLTPTVDPINPITPEGCKCNAQKLEKSGDGLVYVPCRCGASCKCHQNDETGLQPDNTGSQPEVVADDCDKSPKRQIYYIGQENCQPCRQVKQFTFPKLTQLKPDNPNWVPWKIDDSKEAFIRTFEWTQELSEEFDVNSLPTFILFVDKKEVARHVGFLNDIQLSHFFYTGDINKRKVAE